MSKFLHNGKIIKETEANISITDKAYFFDFAVYEALKVVQGKIFFPDYHIERLLASARQIDLGHPFAASQIKQWLNLVVTENQLADSLIRIILIGDADKNTAAQLYLFPVNGVTFYPKHLYQRGAKVITYRGERLIPTAKVKDLLLNFLAYRAAKNAGALDALLVDNNGHIREGTRTNFFALKNKTLYTAPAAEVLEGITKKIILEICAPHFIIEEAHIKLSELEKYDEFFITSTSMNVMPIGQIDDLQLRPDFPQTKLIQKLFQDYYRAHVFA